MKWGAEWYYANHMNAPQWAVDCGLDTKNNAAIYVRAKKQERKLALGSGNIHAMLKRGDYAGAVNKFFAPRTARTKSSGRSD